MKQAPLMATRKKKPKTRAKLKVKAKTKPKAKIAKKKPVPKKKARKAPPAPATVGETQQLELAQIIGDIEERMALDRLAETK